MTTLAEIYHTHKELLESVTQNINNVNDIDLTNQADKSITQPFDTIADFVLHRGVLSENSVIENMFVFKFLDKGLSIGKTIKINGFKGYDITTITYLPDYSTIQFVFDRHGGPCITKDKETGVLYKLYKMQDIPLNRTELGYIRDIALNLVGKMNESVTNGINNISDTTLIDDAERKSGVYYAQKISQYPELVQEIAEAVMDENYDSIFSIPCLELEDATDREIVWFMNVYMGGQIDEDDIDEKRNSIHDWYIKCKTLLPLHSRQGTIEKDISSLMKNDFLDDVNDYLEKNTPEDQRWLMGGRYETKRDLENKILECFIYKLKLQVIEDRE